jgi:hypothetical protein
MRGGGGAGTSGYRENVAPSYQRASAGHPKQRSVPPRQSSSAQPLSSRQGTERGAGCRCLHRTQGVSGSWAEWQKRPC